MDTDLLLEESKIGFINAEDMKITNSYVGRDPIYSNGLFYQAVEPKFNPGNHDSLLITDVEKSELRMLNLQYNSLSERRISMKSFFPFDSPKNGKQMGRILAILGRNSSDYAIFDVELDFNANEYRLTSFIHKFGDVLNVKLFNFSKYMVVRHELENSEANFVVYELNNLKLHTICAFMNKKYVIIDCFGNYLVGRNIVDKKLFVKNLRVPEKTVIYTNWLAEFIGGVPSQSAKSGDKLIFLERTGQKTSLKIIDMESNEIFSKYIIGSFRSIYRWNLIVNQFLLLVSKDPDETLRFYSFPISEPHRLLTLTRMRVKEQIRKGKFQLPENLTLI